jgi:hypothetical protein
LNFLRIEDMEKRRFGKGSHALPSILVSNAWDGPLRL